MAGIVDEESRKYVWKKFREYYSEANIPAPMRFSKREYGFIHFNAPMKRHIAFDDYHSIKEYFVRNVPLHAYYSSAYYEYPEKPMDKKGWLGADLIFDLDADHLIGAESLSYEEQLSKVKIELNKLLTFLQDDFGFSENEIHVNFSGGRGYHIHIRSPEVLTLRSDARREIVSYITAKHLKKERFIMVEFVKPDKHTRSSKKVKFSKKPFGWYDKVRYGITEALEELYSRYESDRKSLRNEMPPSLYKRLFSKKGDKLLIEILIKEPENFHLVGERKMYDLVDYLFEYLSVQVAGETDEPVTTDIHRLIRYPESLHGKTGFVVKPLDMNDIDEFNPFVDALPHVSGEEYIEFIVDVNITLGNTRYVNSKSEIEKVPAAHALYFLCSGKARINP